MTGFYKELTHVPERRVLILGLSGVGKTSILEWLKHPGGPGNLDKLPSTVGLNVHKLSTPTQRLLVWDLGGAEKLRPIWEPYLKQADAVVWVVDCSSASDMPDSARVLESVVTRPRFRGRPLLILANKCDKDGVVTPVDTAVQLDLLAAADTRSQAVYAVSGKTGYGIAPAFEWLAERLCNPETPGAHKTTIK